MDNYLNDDLLETLRKASLELEKNASEPFDYHGYSIFTTPAVSKKIKGFKLLEESRQSVLIRNILVNEEKRLVTVVFVDGGHEIIQCAKGDHFDVNIGVALAIAQHFYGSKNKFHKEVIKKAKTIEKKTKGNKK